MIGVLGVFCFLVKLRDCAYRRCVHRVQQEFVRQVGTDTATEVGASAFQKVNDQGVCCFDLSKVSTR